MRYEGADPSREESGSISAEFPPSAVPHLSVNMTFMGQSENEKESDSDASSILVPNNTVAPARLFHADDKEEFAADSSRVSKESGTQSVEELIPSSEDMLPSSADDREEESSPSSPLREEESTSSTPSQEFISPSQEEVISQEESRPTPTPSAESTQAPPESTQVPPKEHSTVPPLKTAPPRPIKDAPLSREDPLPAAKKKTTCRWNTLKRHPLPKRRIISAKTLGTLKRPTLPPATYSFASDYNDQKPVLLLLFTTAETTHFSFKGLVFTHSPIIIRFCEQHGVDVIEYYRTNPYNMPLIRDLFQQAYHAFAAEFYGYVNSDIILDTSLFALVKEVKKKVAKKEFSSMVWEWVGSEE